MIATTVLTGNIYQWVDDDADLQTLTVRLAPSVPKVVSSATNEVVLLSVLSVQPDDDGNFSITVPSSDAPDFSPTQWTWNIRIQSDRGAYTSFPAVLPHGETVDLSEVIPVDHSEGQPVLRGPRGLPGADGKDGVDGVDGAPGRDGVDGAPGADGRDGVDGAPGADGAPGKDGAPGADGRDGVDGVDGAPGRDGVDGTNGVRGSRWYISSVATPDPVNVSGMIEGDIFLYPATGDLFRYSGTDWEYAGALTA